MHSPNSLGLSAVLPEMRATRGLSAGGRSSTEERKVVLCSDLMVSAHSLNSGPPGEVAPGPRNQGSMM